MSGTRSTAGGSDELPRLAALGASPLPAEVLEHWQSFERLSDVVVDSLWELLGPFLSHGPGAEFEQRCDAFCRLRQVQAAEVLPGLNACQLLVNEAAARNLDAAAFAKDLEQLPDAGGRIANVLSAGYEKVLPALRTRILGESLGDHGNVLCGVDWRVDHMVASGRGLQLDAPVAVLTLRYQVGDRAERLTLHADPQQLAGLRDVCDRILGSRDTPPASRD